MRRTVISEFLDTDAGTPQEVQASLADLRLANRWFGGASTTCSLLDQVAKHSGLRKLSMLDVAAASGDVAKAAVTHLKGQGIALDVVVLDRSASHLNGKLPSVQGDALALPFREQSFDVVASSLFAHHLEPAQIQEFVNQALRIARIAVLINDLRRHPLHLGLIYAGSPLFSRLTRHDAPASVRRAYTPVELAEILRGTHASRVEVSRHFLFRVGAIAWKHLP